MLSRTFAGAVQGIEAQKIIIEVHAGGAVPLSAIGYYLVGLPDNAVREGYHRIISAIKSIGLRIPRIKIVINLAPADVRKEGSLYDLPIAIGMLHSTEQIEAPEVEQYMMMGELALDGTIRPIKGALSIAIKAKKEGFKGIILPQQNALLTLTEFHQKQSF